MRKEYQHLRIAFTLSMATFLVAGCRVSAPIHVWVPPKLQSAVGQKVAIAPIVGEPRIAGPLLTQMLALAPRDSGRALVCIDARSSLPNQTIRLVSGEEGETSDIANVSLARKQAADFLLTGEIVRQPSEARSASHHAAQGLNPSIEPKENQLKDQITVSWKLTDLRGHTGASGFPIVTQHDAPLDPQGIANAAAQDAWKLITPHVAEDSVKLAAPRVSRGSPKVRSGNEAAIAGDWMTAQVEWNRVLVVYPRNHAAMHNLAIAAVARQDYASATRLIGSALRTANRPLYRETAVWIEAKQRDYHEAFGLPDPPSGWSAIRR